MHAVVHYGEIGTKSGNRRAFEDRLARNIARVLAPVAALEVRRESGRLVFPLDTLPEARRDEALRVVALQPGVAWIASAVRTAPTLDALSATAVDFARRATGTFRIKARRSDKTLPFDSYEVQRVVGRAVQDATGRAVHLDDPASLYVVEVDRHAGYVFDARTEGPDGLPVGSAGKVVALLSGGIDSPVAAWRMMVRGCEVLALHLWNRSYSGEGVRDKVLDLGRALARHQGRLKVVLVPFDEIQREIVAASPADLRMLLYRRAMLRVATRVRAAAKAQGIVVGDSVSQVASQTLSNLATVYQAAEPPLLAPLHGAVKRHTVATAQRIGTYEISVRPGQDCCGLMVARHPRTSSTLDEVLDVEAKYDLAALVEAAAEERETHEFRALDGDADTRAAS